MKAFIIQKPNCVEMQEVEKPIADPDEAVVRVAYAGMCATDLAILSGDMSLIRNGSIRFPVRFGHEWAGVVESVGAEVTDLKPGDRVISESGVTCGKCEACQQQRWADCPDIKSVGTVNCWDGAFAEYMHVPARHLTKIPDNISLREAAVIEPSCIALAGVTGCNVSAGKTVLVVGTGAIGMAAVALSKYYGAEYVVLSGRTDEKLAVGKQMGADHVLNVTRESVMEFVKKQPKGFGFDVVIETSGNIQAIGECLEATRYGGHIGLIGFYEKTVPQFAIDEIVMKSLNVHGIMGRFGMPAQMLEVLQSGKVDLKPLITHEIPFEETADAMQDMGRFGKNRIKLLVKISDQE